MDREREELNPGLSAEACEAMAAKVRWRGAPIWAGAYIAVCVEHDVDAEDESGNILPRVETSGCWMIHDTHQRVPAPDFGITELAPGQSFILRRPGSKYDGIACLLLRTYFEHANVLNLARHEITEPPDPDYRRPARLVHTPLCQGVAIGMARWRVQLSQGL